MCIRDRETARACGAFVIHHEVGHIACIIDTDHLAVLPADIDDRAHIGVQEKGPSGVTGNLSDGFIAALNRRAAIAGGHSSSQLLPGEVRLTERDVYKRQAPLRASGDSSPPGPRHHIERQACGRRNPFHLSLIHL